MKPGKAINKTDARLGFLGLLRRQFVYVHTKITA